MMTVEKSVISLRTAWCCAQDWPQWSFANFPWYGIMVAKFADVDIGDLGDAKVISSSLLPFKSHNVAALSQTAQKVMIRLF